MMYIRAKTGNTFAELTWWVGGDRPLAIEDVILVVEVQADGDELAYIKRNFENLPMRVNKPEVTWYGDDARFIVGNIQRG